jgi:pimeloyl-ACP methyl ester carboxylesterase
MRHLPILSLALSVSLVSLSATAGDAVTATANSAPTAPSVQGATWKTVPTQVVSSGGVDFAYRELGRQNGGTPVVFLVHLAAVLDNWDPRVVDGTAAKRHVIAFDNRGIGASSGSPSNTMEQMADDAIAFIKAKGLKQVDLFGFSMGGMIAQEIVLKEPQLVRKMILYNGRGIASSTGTPRTRIEHMADDAAAVIRALGLTQVDVLGFSLGGFIAQDLTRRHPGLVRKLMLLGTGPRGGNPDSEPPVLEVATHPVPTVEDFLYLFFGRSEKAQKAGRDFWARRHQRVDQDPPSSPAVMQAQIEANMHYLPKLDPKDPFAHLREIRQPTFILNGVHDVMIPTINSWHMAQNIPNAQLFIYPDAGHATQFQYPSAS